MRMPLIAMVTVLVAASITTAMTAMAQRAQTPPPVAPARPYKVVTVKMPDPLKDAGFEALRKQIADAAGKKDRGALGKLVIDQGFFWDRESGDAADKKKPGIDNLANALGLANKDGAGWDMLNGYAQDPTASPAPDHKGAVCSPADPSFNDRELQDVVKATGTDPGEWAYALMPGAEVRSTAQANAPVIEKLGLHFIRVMPDMNPAAAATSVKIVTPSGKTGFVTADSIAPLGNDQICYVKDASGWKIGGYIGGGDSQ